MKIGFIINPIAGLGASLAWKGTDSVEMAWKMVSRGIKQPVWEIVDRALKSIKTFDGKIFFGGKITQYLGQVTKLNYEEIGYLSIESNKLDTQRLTEQINELEVDLLLFAGGDGTAVDIAEKIGKTPILGIPSGVKIFSPCFLHNPEDLGNFLNQWNKEVKRIDLFDIDEKAYKTGLLKSKLVGSVNVPYYSNIQKNKISWSISDEVTDHKSIASRIIDDQLLNNKTILIGPGSTMKLIFKELNIPTSLLGIDILMNNEIIKQDATYKDIINFHIKTKINQIWLSPIGHQGHIFGRGNRQIPYSIIQEIGKSNILLFATLTKMENTKELYTDSGNDDVDKALRGYYDVITGFHTSAIRKVL